MREISPAISHSCDEYLRALPQKSQELIAAIRSEKNRDVRPLPSSKLLDCSKTLDSDFRNALVDRVACLVDENLCGRSDMCQQFAYLISLALNEIGIANYPVSGTAMYYAEGKEIFRLEHAWVRAGGEVVDGNTDILYENPAVLNGLEISPYWGLLSDMPSDRRLREGQRNFRLQDSDIDEIWWPELKLWLLDRKSI